MPRQNSFLIDFGIQLCNVLNIKNLGRPGDVTVQRISGILIYFFIDNY